MYIINQDYFVRELSVPLTGEMNSKPLTELLMFIDEGSRFVLLNALGYTLFADFDSNVTDGVFNEGAPQKWKNLVNGYEYTKDGVTIKWKGLIYEEGSFKGSLLAHFVFHQWLTSQTSTLTGVGEVSIQAKNATGVNSTQRLVSVWNTFLEMYQGQSTSYCRTYCFNGVPVTDYYAANGQEVSLIQFLQDNPEDYPNAALVRYEAKNQLGL